MIFNNFSIDLRSTSDQLQAFLEGLSKQKDTHITSKLNVEACNVKRLQQKVGNTRIYEIASAREWPSK